MMQNSWILGILTAMALVACSDPADKIDPAVEKTRADSLRVEIRTTEARIESLKTERVQRMKTLDSLGIPHDSL